MIEWGARSAPLLVSGGVRLAQHPAQCVEDLLAGEAVAAGMDSIHQLVESLPDMALAELHHVRDQLLGLPVDGALDHLVILLEAPFRAAGAELCDMLHRIPQVGRDGLAVPFRQGVIGPD